MSYLRRLISSDSKDSSKRFALVVGVVIAAAWTLVFLPVLLFVDLFTGRSITTNLYAVAALVVAIEAILAILILAKVKSEMYERSYGFPRNNHTSSEGFDG